MSDAATIAAILAEEFEAAPAHALTQAQREERNARIRALYAKIAAESGERDALSAVVARFGADRQTIRNMLKKENAK